MRKYLLSGIPIMFLTFSTAYGQTGLYTYDGGYFLRNGSRWEEYRPDSKLGVWAAYEQYAEDDNFYSISNSLCVVSVPKTSSGSFFYAKPGGTWTPIYTTREIYDYVPDGAGDLYCYEGGYFVRDGLVWSEYRPGERHDIWNTYDQTGCDGKYFYLKSDDGSFQVRIPVSGTDNRIYMRKGDGAWTAIYTMTGIYDGGRGFAYSIPFEEMRFYDSDTETFGSVQSEVSRVSFSSDGTGQVRYSDKKYSFSFGSCSLYESSGTDLSGLLSLFLFGSASAGGDGFIFYADEKEIVSYVDIDDDVTCTVSGIPGLPVTMFLKCADTTVGNEIHDMIEDGTFSKEIL